ncbi:MAG: 4-hydroxybenzoate octaprenyltransferase [Thermodesulfobacteriota bacterium]
MSTVALTKKLSAISDLIRLTKQYGTLLVLCPTLWSLYMASGGNPSPRHLAVFVAGAFLMRSAGCAVNDIADRDFDRHVERTRTRPIADGRLDRREALVIFILLCLAAFTLVLTLNRLTILLSIVGVSLAALYPFIKRVSHFPQVVLGVAFGWGAVMAWAAVKESVGMEALLILAANICWSTAYDTVYAVMDMDDDRRVGVKSTALFFGRHIYKALIALNLFFVLLLAVTGWIGGLGLPFFLTLLLVFVMLNWMVFKLRESPTRETAFLVFVANCLVGALILIGIVISMGVQ